MILNYINALPVKKLQLKKILELKNLNIYQIGNMITQNNYRKKYPDFVKVCELIMILEKRKAETN